MAIPVRHTQFKNVKLSMLLELPCSVESWQADVLLKPYSVNHYFSLRTDKRPNVFLANISAFNFIRGKKLLFLLVKLLQVTD